MTVSLSSVPKDYRKPVTEMLDRGWRIINDGGRTGHPITLVAPSGRRYRIPTSPSNPASLRHDLARWRREERMNPVPATNLPDTNMAAAMIDAARKAQTPAPPKVIPMLPPLPYKRGDSRRIVLDYLAEHGPSTVDAIAAAAKLPRTTIASRMTHLKEKGLVVKDQKRRPAPWALRHPEVTQEPTPEPEPESAPTPEPEPEVSGGWIVPSDLQTIRPPFTLLGLPASFWSEVCLAAASAFEKLGKENT